MKALVLHARYADTYSYYDDWLDAFMSAGPQGLAAEAANVCSPDDAARLRGRADEYDLIVLLHSTNADTLSYLVRWEPLLTSRRRARLLCFVGNEYNQPRSHVGMGEKIAFLRRVEPEWVASQLPLATALRLYEDLPRSRAVSIPHALNPERFRPAVPHAARPIDIGVRSAHYTPLLGDTDRVDLVRRFAGGDLPVPLAVDVDLGGHRFEPDAWARFLGSCRGTVATEAGASYLEKDDRTANRIRRYLTRRHPDLFFYGLEKRVKRPWWRARATTGVHKITAELIRWGLSPGADAHYAAADFADLHARFFYDHPKGLSGKCISSRHFEAIGTKTCQLMFPGEFNGILRADRHYLALRRDFSDLREVLEAFRDGRLRQRIVDDAYELVMDAHTYRHRIAQVVALLEGS